MDDNSIDNTRESKPKGREADNKEAINIERQHPVREGREIFADENRQEQFYKLKHTVYYILGVFEVLLGFRLIFKLLGASPASGFVSFLYSLTGIFTAPFTGIFKTFVSNADSTQFILEPGTIIAMVVYAVIAYGIVRLVRIRLAGQV